MNDTKQLETQVMTVPEKARALKIVNNETYALAGGMLVEIKGLRKQINASFDPIIEKAHQAHKEAVAQKRKVEAPLAEAESVIKPAMARWDAEQERIRREQERKMQELARKQAEERQLAEAAALEAQGETKAADEVIAAPVEVAPVVLQKTVPKVEGVSFREVWKFQIVDAKAIPREYLVPDEVKIGQVVRALKGSANIPGVRAYAEKTVAGRG